MGTKGTENRMINQLEVVSIQLMSPASGDPQETIQLVSVREVSIQLMSPASGDCKRLKGFRPIRLLKFVSIQLMSPASGD